MSSVQIPNLPAVANLSGAELLEAVQAGSSVKVSLNQLNALFRIGPVSFPLAVDIGGTGTTTSTGTGSVVLSNNPVLVNPSFSIGSFGLGTVTAPSITFTGDLNTGIWSPGADTVAVSTGGVERLRIDSAGNVGIGTAAPTFRLHVETNTDTNAGSFIRNNNTGTGASGSLFVASLVGNISMRAHSAAHSSWPNSTLVTSDAGFTGGLNIVQNGANPIKLWTNGSERMRIIANGKVLIGRTGQATSSAGILAEAEGRFLSIVTGQGAYTFGNVQSGNAFVISDASNGTTEVERLRIDSAGIVGIGTIIPASYATRLAVVGGNLGISEEGSTVFTLRSNAGVSSLGAFNATGAALTFRTAPSGGGEVERMRIDSVGNVGIGVTPSVWSTGKAIEVFAAGNSFFSNGAGVLRLTSNAYFNGSYLYGNTAAASRYDQNVGVHSWHTAPSGTAGTAITFTQAMTLDANGNLVVGTTVTAPTSRVTVATSDGTVPGNTSGLNAIRIRSTATAGVGVGPSILFEGQTGNSTANYGFAAIQGFKGSATASDYAGVLAFYTQNTGGSSSLTERMRIDGAGNVGLGVTPSAWGVGKVMQIGSVGGGFVFGETAQSIIGLNAYYDTSWKYGGTGVASYYTQRPAGHQWWNAPSGTAGAAITFTQAMTLDANGNLGIGVTSPSSKVAILGSTSDAWAASGEGLALNGNTGAGTVSTVTTFIDNSALRIGAGSTQKTGILIGGQSYAGPEGNSISFRVGNAERARLFSSGGFSIGNTADPGNTNLSVTGLGSFGLGAVATPSITFNGDLNTGIWSPAADTVAVSTNGAERMRITSAGDITQTNAVSGAGAIVGEQTFRLAADGTSFGPTIGDFFGPTSSISLEASSVYEVTIYAVFTKTTAGTATFTLTASSAPTRMIGTYQASPITGIAAGAVTSGFAGSQGATTAAFAATGSLSTAVNHAYQFDVQLQTNAATNFRLQLTQSAGTATPLAGSYYTVKKISATIGTFVA